MSLRLIDVEHVSLRQLRDVAAGRDNRLPRTAALQALLRSDFPNKHRDFEAILDNGAESPALRRIAARLLGKIETPWAREILVRSTAIRDPEVLTAIVEALGRIGDEAALPAILQARSYVPANARRKADFAAALIAHRFGLPDDFLGDSADLERPSEFRPECGIPLRISSALHGEVETALVHLAREPFGVEYAESSTVHVRCQSDSWLFFTNRQLVAADAVELLRRRRTFGGIVATRINTEQDYFPALVLLTAPLTNERIGIRIYAPDGSLRYAGAGDLESSSIRFRIRAIPFPGSVPIELSGVFIPPAIRIDTALAEGRTHGKRHPARLAPAKG